MADLPAVTNGRRDNLLMIETLWTARDTVEAQLQAPDREALRKVVVNAAVAKIQAAAGGDATKLRQAVLDAATDVYKQLSEDEALRQLVNQFDQLWPTVPFTPIHEARLLIARRRETLKARSDIRKKDKEKIDSAITDLDRIELNLGVPADKGELAK